MDTKTALKTLAYFDAFSRPLTRLEIERWMWQGTQPQPNESPVLPEKDGYYFLPGREEIVATHQERVKLVEKKVQIAARAGKWLRWVPFIRAVFVCNTVAMGSPKESSDVDVFIVVRHGHIWTARLCATLLLFITGLRRGKAQAADHVCLSFYHTDRSLDLSGIRLFPDDIYLVYWLLQLVPLYDPHAILSQIQRENAWVREFVPAGFEPYALIKRHRVDDTVCTRCIQRLGEAVLDIVPGNGVEKMLRALQLWKMRQNTKSIQDAPDTRVVISDTMLKFHENDRRAFYRDEWLKKSQTFLDNEKTR